MRGGENFAFSCTFNPPKSARNWREVFDNILGRTITDEEIKTFDHIYNGVDWGFYPDPWAFNRMYYDSARRTLYILGEFTKYKAGNRETVDALSAFGLTGEDRITADSAELKWRVRGLLVGKSRTFLLVNNNLYICFSK